MKFNLYLGVACLTAGLSLLAPAATAQTKETPKAAVTDGKDIDAQLAERQEKIGLLTTDEQLVLRAAEKKAGEDPNVLAALEKRDRAIKEFRAAMHDSMVKEDPRVQPLLDKIGVAGSPGF